MIHSISSATNARRPCLSPLPIAAKKSFTIWTFSSMLIESLRFRYIGSCDVCDHDSSVEFDQVLKDQLTPAISARLHKQSTFRKPAKFDRRETEFFRKRTNLRCCAVIVAMTLQRPSLPSSRGPTRRAHPKTTSWRQRGLPRCLRWACLHPLGGRHEVGAGTCQGFTNR